MSRSRSRTTSRSASPAKGKASPEPVSESTCPFLIRVFVSKGKHAPMIDFDEGNFPIRDEFHAYGWKHTTPTSLIALLYPSFPPVYRSPLARYSFRHIYVDASQRGLYRNRDLVSFTGRELLATLSTSDSGLAKPSAVSMDMELDDAPDHGPSRRGAGRKVEEKTLDSYGFITGDLLSVSIHIPEPRTPAPAPPLGAVRPSIGAGPAGAGAPGFGGRELLARNGPNAARGLPPREPHPSDQDGNWSRGEALPSSNFKGRGDRRDRARDDGFANGGRADVRGSGPGGPARRRTPSPHRNRDRVERSRSPDARRSRY